MNLYYYKRETHKIKKELKKIENDIHNRNADKNSYKRKRFLEMLLFVYQTNIKKLREERKKVR